MTPFRLSMMTLALTITAHPSLADPLMPAEAAKHIGEHATGERARADGAGRAARASPAPPARPGTGSAGAPASPGAAWRGLAPRARPPTRGERAAGAARTATARRPADAAQAASAARM